VIKARFPWSLGMTEDCIQGVNWTHVLAETISREASLEERAGQQLE
jgi:hypothetical protein